MNFNFAEVIVENNSINTDKPFTYKIDENLKGVVKPGMRVIVPFGKGNKNIQGIVINLLEDFQSKYKLKSIIDILDDKPIISDNLLKLSKWISEFYLASYLDGLNLVLPPGNYKRINTFIRLGESIDYSLLLNLEAEEVKIISYLENKDYVLLSKLKEELKINKINDFLTSLDNRKFIEIYIDINTEINKKYEKLVRLKSRDNQDHEKISKKQLEVIDYLLEQDGLEARLKDIMTDLEISNSPIKTLEKKNILLVEDREVVRNPVSKKIEKYNKFILNKEQENVYNKIINGGQDTYLIHGVTGSGKTEIYLQLVEKMIEEGKDSIILVPEIALTPQTIDRFIGRFKGQVAVLHSKLSSGERFDQWRMIRDGKVKIVVGARSAVFAPVKDLGLIIIDEEHEDSYKSSNNPKYDTIEVARKRIELENASLVLGTATPSIETYYKAKDMMKYKLLTLEERVNKNMPEVNIIDMREELELGNKTIFSKALYDGIKYNLENKKQTILFLNKRGFTSFISCRACGYVLKCKSCDVSMTYHKNIGRVKCHYCGDTQIVPKLCPECGSEYIKHFGIGTEQVEYITREMFKDATVARMDTDTMGQKNSYEETLGRMKAKEIDILIGTQMISKGLDFENVTLVGIIAADTTLNLPDFRSSERSFQLTTQVAGRAGRSKDLGRVILQSYNPEHYSLQYAKEHNYEGFYEEELRIRKAFAYPPFKNIVNILVYGEGYNRVRQSIGDIKIALYKEIEANEYLSGKVQILGPYPAGLEKIKNNFRWHIMIKADDSEMFLVKKIVKNIGIENINKINLKDIKLSVDINPTSII